MTAEGIETVEQMVVLRNLNCDYLQGFLCGKPTAKANLAAIILKEFFRNAGAGKCQAFKDKGYSLRTS